MKNIIEKIIKILIFIVFIGLIILLFKVPSQWILTIIFGFNFVLIGAYIYYGAISGNIFLGLIILFEIIGIVIGLRNEMFILPFFLEILITISIFFLLKKIDEINNYYLYTVKDTLKIKEGEYKNLLLEEENLKKTIKANKEKYEKYKKLKEIYKEVQNIKVFSEKIRYILRNVIFAFHKDSSIILFLLKEKKFLKIMANKNEDMFVGEKEPENLYLKSFDEWVINNKKSILVSDMQKEVRFRNNLDNKENVRSLISIPIFFKNDVEGILRITSEEPKKFNQEDLRFLDLIAEMIGKILEEENV